MGVDTIEEAYSSRLGLRFEALRTWILSSVPVAAVLQREEARGQAML